MVYLLAFLAAVHTASAALYPTRPYSDTVYSAGSAGRISWVDDGKYPRIHELGMLRVDLFTADDTFVETLAKDVNPLEKALSVNFPPTTSANASEYMLSFTSTSPPFTFYTADFIISPASPTITALQANSTANFITLVLPSTTITSQLAPMPNRASLMQAQTTVPAQPLLPGDGGHPYVKTTGRAASQRVDLEKIKFRLVFIVWPALVGITMAM